MSVCGVQVFAPYQRLSCRAAGSPSPGQPARPLLRDDPDHVGQVAAAFATALLNGQEPKPGRFSDGVLNHPAADPGPGCDFIHAPITVAVLAHLVPDDAQDRQLTDRELAGESRWHWTRGGKVTASRNRHRALGSPLQPPGREDRRSAKRDAHRLDFAPEDAPAGVQVLGESLGIIVAHSTGGEALPDRAG